MNLKRLEIDALKQEISTLSSQMHEELNNYHYYEEGLEYLKKTIEKQRGEINSMKELVKRAEVDKREAEIGKEAALM